MQRIHNSQDNMNNSSILPKANPMELSWDNVVIDATIPNPNKGKNNTAPKTIEKTIIKNSKGILRPGTFTALIGPSGSGKTTLLNYLSGRLYSPNLNITGSLKINGKETEDITKFGNQMAYVMQDDLLLATFSPREAFMFIAKMKLPQLSQKQQEEKVESLIKELGLQEAANTLVGNKMIRGVSGGERKRTSIGVELLTNPSLLFLDEPTTGLDSSTALQVIELLNNLSKIKGVNIVSTIHQPSSETFAQFENLILLAQGNIIYQGEAKEALGYFKEQGFLCPKFSNPCDFFMNLMNEEGLMIEKIKNGEILPEDEFIQKEFQGRMQGMIEYYGINNNKDLEKREKSQGYMEKNQGSLSCIKQFETLMGREMRGIIRNPMDFKMKMTQSIFIPVLMIIFFNDLGEEGFGAIQNRNGALFFLTSSIVFMSTQDSLAIFLEQKGVYLRERGGKAYGPVAYYLSRVLAVFPMQIIVPFVQVSIMYFGIGLNNEEGGKYPILVFIAVLTYWTSASYGFLLSVLFPSLELAMSLVPVLVVPFMVLGGLFVNSDQIPWFFKWAEYISIFKWSFQAAALNEFNDLPTIECGCVPYTPGDEQYLKLLQKNPDLNMGDCIPMNCDPLEQHGFGETLGETIGILVGIGFAYNILAILGLYLISKPKKVVANNKKLQQ